MTHHQKCKCKNSRLLFKKYHFTGARVAYKGTCVKCGLVRCWMEGKNYKIVAGVLSDNTQKGGDKKTG